MSPMRHATLHCPLLTLAIAAFAWYWPVHTAITIPREAWNLRMWFDFWT